MSIKIGDLVTIKNDYIDILQIKNYPLLHGFTPIRLKVKRGLIFEVLEVYGETNSARVLPVNHGITDEFVIVVELENLLKCGRAVEYLYGKKKD